MAKIKTSDLFCLYLRSFLVQNGWNYERMTALGFAWILKPLAKRLFESAEEQKSFLKRHLLGFNANPYMVDYAVGAVVKLEEDKTPEEQIVRFKSSLHGPLGAIGDRLIWQNLKPAVLILSLALCIAIGAWGAAVGWLLFNLFQVYHRARGLVKGYKLGWELPSELTKGYLQSMTEWSNRLGAVFLGILLVLKTGHVKIKTGQPENILILVGFSLISVFAFRRNFNPNYIILLSLVLFLLIKTIILLV